MYIDQLLPTRFRLSRIIFLVALNVGFYAFKNSSLSSTLSGTFINHLVEPLFWITITIMLVNLPNVRFKSKFRHARFIYWGALSLAIFLVIAQILGGLLDGFGYSPYSHTPKGMAINIFAAGTTLLGRELIRNYLVNSISANESYPKFIVISIFMTMIIFPLSKFTSLNNLQSTVVFVAQFFAPELAKNLMATYLVYLGGPLASLIYIGVLQAFHWLSPILPDLKWITAALIGILVPVFSLLTLQHLYMEEAKLHKVKDKNEEGIFGWALTTLVSISIIWFSVGVFPIYPSVIATGSMKPIIDPGDVILVDKGIDIDQLRKGDLIQFKRDSILISHRIIEVVEVDGKKCFRTKGDNNSTEDADLVQLENVKGKIIKVIPKIGWPTLLIRSDKNIPLDQLEF